MWDFAFDAIEQAHGRDTGASGAGGLRFLCPEGEASDWLLGLSEYRLDQDRQLTVDDIGLSEQATIQLSAMAGSAAEEKDLGEQAKTLYSKAGNPNEYSVQEEARAFKALNILLEKPEFVWALSMLGRIWNTLVSLTSTKQ